MYIYYKILKNDFFQHDYFILNIEKSITDFLVAMETIYCSGVRFSYLSYERDHDIEHRSMWGTDNDIVERKTSKHIKNKMTIFIILLV